MGNWLSKWVIYICDNVLLQYCCLVLGYVIGVSAIGCYGFKCNSLFTKCQLQVHRNVEMHGFLHVSNSFWG